MGVLRALRITTPPPPAAATEHPSYILKILAAELGCSAACRNSCRVLDLGPSVRENFEFYSNFSAHIQIEDLASSLYGPAEEPADGPPKRLLEDAERFCEGKGLDLIVCWDIFNYCTPEEAANLGQKLAELSKPGTRLFALIGTHARIPALPSVFKITDQLRLIYQTATSETIACPKRTKTDLARLLPGFTRLRSFLLRNGMEEELFVFE